MENYVKKEINEYGSVIYTNSREQKHRLDGPAIEWMDGSKFWYKNGHWHRTDGPALIFAHGRKCWYVNGQQHRLDGPSIVYETGQISWSINGYIYSKSKHNRLVLFFMLEPGKINLNLLKE